MHKINKMIIVNRETRSNQTFQYKLILPNHETLRGKLDEYEALISDEIYRNEQNPQLSLLSNQIFKIQYQDLIYHPNLISYLDDELDRNNVDGEAFEEYLNDNDMETTQFEPNQRNFFECLRLFLYASRKEVFDIDKIEQCFYLIPPELYQEIDQFNNGRLNFFDFITDIVHGSNTLRMDFNYLVQFAAKAFNFNLYHIWYVPERGQNWNGTLDVYINEPISKENIVIISKCVLLENGEPVFLNFNLIWPSNKLEILEYCREVLSTVQQLETEQLNIASSSELNNEMNECASSTSNEGRQSGKKRKTTTYQHDLRKKRSYKKKKTQTDNQTNISRNISTEEETQSGNETNDEEAFDINIRNDPNANTLRRPPAHFFALRDRINPCSDIRTHNIGAYAESGVVKRGNYAAKEVSGICEFCNAKYFVEEVNYRYEYTECCRTGMVDLSEYVRDDYPNVLVQLIFPDREDEEQMRKHRHFKEYIRLFNSALAFAAVTCKLDSSLRQYRPNYVYKISGGMYYQVPACVPMPDEMQNHNIQGIQYYVMDTDNNTRHRQDRYDFLNREVI
jgi:hypothetical protein